MSETQEQVKPNGPEKPKRQRKTEAIVPVEPEVRLGSWAVNSPSESVKKAEEMAATLSDIINKQELFSIIKNKKTGEKRKYVKCEGWTTMGAMLGVFPVEDYCRTLPNAKGYEAKINLVRSRDGMVVGSASAECTTDEDNWKSRDSFSLRSMALTRATSKAFRLSFSWIIKLAGYEATPAEEMMGNEDASLGQAAVEAEVEHQKAEHAPRNASNGEQKGNSVLFWTEPEQFNSHRAIFVNLKEYGANLNEVAAEGLKLVLKKYIKMDSAGDFWVPTSGENNMPQLIAELEKLSVKTKKLGAR